MDSEQSERYARAEARLLALARQDRTREEAWEALARKVIAARVLPPEDVRRMCRF